MRIRLIWIWQIKSIYRTGKVFFIKLANYASSTSLWGKELRQNSSYTVVKNFLKAKEKNTSQLINGVILIVLKRVIFNLNIYVMPWKFKAKSKIKKPEMSLTHLHRCLLVVFGIQNLFSTHCTDGLFVGTALAVMGTRLVHRTFTNSASGELIFSIWIESCFFFFIFFLFF